MEKNLKNVGEKKIHSFSRADDMKHPDYNIIIWIKNGEKTITPDRLYIRGNMPNYVIYHDQETNCFSEYYIKGEELMDPFEHKIKLGNISEIIQKKAG